MDWTLPYPSRRVPLLARQVVATTQPLAAQAGLRMLQVGGNAVDAALATAIALTVVEPIMNGIGGDLYALVWDGQTLHGLDATGAAPAAWTPQRFAGRSEMPRTGWDSVTVPGQVSGWVALSERFGQLPFERLFEPAIAYAEQGFAVSPVIGSVWPQLAELVATQPGFAEAFTPGGRSPEPGEIWRFADQARTLGEIARTRGESFYRGALAEKLAAHAAAHGGAMTLADLAAQRAAWVQPLAQRYRDVVLHEIPPNGQGIAAQMALGMLQHFELAVPDSADTLHLQIEAMKLAFADLHAHVADPRSMRLGAADLLDPAYLAQRARAIDPKRANVAAAGRPRAGGTVYLSAADADGRIVSLIQSNYYAFGSGIVVPGTGIAMHNRGWNFSLQSGHPNEVGPGKKPLHTIIPGFVTTADGAPLMGFGVMGGFMQAQGHMQMVCRHADFGQNPQAMIDAPRFMVSPLTGAVKLEGGIDPAVADALAARGHRIEWAPWGHLDFGAAQIVLNTGTHYTAASDGRRDGQAVGF